MGYNPRMYEEAFETALARAREENGGGGIGTLSEKLLHRTLKYLYEPDPGKHEAEVGGFFADVLNSGGITEIQTGSFFHIDKKLGVFLKEYPVTLVCPVVREKRLVFIDPDSGEMTKPRLSPKKGRVESVFRELVHIRKRLSDDNLVVSVVLTDAMEYRVRRGPRRFRDKGYDRAELVPTAFVSETVFVTADDWLRLLPGGMDGFTVRELAGELKLDARTAQAMCASLVCAGALTRDESQRSYIYYRVTT